ncbi:MAG: 3-deoxy-7-phosphoheptulonate synthase [Clostridium sp.]|uniref:3-deoxy-7-phosphoheptulonate synthase n=1 Tax=Clostridium sp. TaxID=1506 RepID=UPI003059DD76
MKEILADKNSGDSIKVRIKDVVIGGDELTFISGPCAVEDYNKMMAIGKSLKNQGVHMIRAGAYKPRTSPYDFQGLGLEGLKILKAVGDKFELPVVSEVMDTRDIEVALQYVDMIQVGSRNMYNYTFLKELGKLKIPILLKRGISATISEWVYAAEYILKEGNMNVVLCERGIRTFETSTRNTLDLNSVAMIKENYRLPIIVDPSHGTGRRELVKPMSFAAIGAGADGLIIESHVTPDNSVSDARQTINVEGLKEIMNKCNTLKGIL